MKRKIISANIQGFAWFVEVEGKPQNITYAIKDIIGLENCLTASSELIFSIASDICDSKNGNDFYALEVDENGEVFVTE